MVLKFRFSSREQRGKKIKIIPKDGREILIVYGSHSTNVGRLIIEGEK